MKILAFSGSLRKNSYNTKALHLAESLAPEGVDIHVYNISSLPFMNQDLEDEGFPKEVGAFRDAVKDADAILISTPEYNNTYSSITKNAVEWLSRAPSAARGKRLGIMGASDGDFGAVRALLMLRALASVVGFDLLNENVVAIPNASKVFDEGDNERTKRHITELISALAE